MVWPLFVVGLLVAFLGYAFQRNPAEARQFLARLRRTSQGAQEGDRVANIAESYFRVAGRVLIAVGFLLFLGGFAV